MKKYFLLASLLFISSMAHLKAQGLCYPEFETQGFKIKLPCKYETLSNTNELVDIGYQTGTTSETFFSVRVVYRKMQNPASNDKALEALRAVVKNDEWLTGKEHLTPTIESSREVKMMSNPYQGFYCKASARVSDKHYKRILESYLFLGENCNVMIICQHIENYNGTIDKGIIFGSFEWLPITVKNSNLGIQYSRPRYSTTESARQDNNGSEIKFVFKNKKSKLEIFKVKTSEKEFVASQTNNKANYKFDNGMTLGPDSRFTEYYSYKTKINDIEYLVKYYLFKNNGQLLCARIFMEANSYGIFATDVENSVAPILKSIK